jgi:hypothetical protein
MADKPPELATSLEDSTQPNAHALQLKHQHQTSLWHEMQAADKEWVAAYAHHASPPFEYNVQDSMSNNDTHVTLFKYHDGFDGDAAYAEPNHGMIELPVCKLVVPGVTEVDWAENVEEDMGFALNGEYKGPSYSPAPPPTPWYPPPPPTSDYMPPQTHYIPSHTQYRPPTPTTCPAIPNSAPAPTPHQDNTPVSKTNKVM